MCVFELVLGGDKEGGEVLGKEAGEGGGVSQQDLNMQHDVKYVSLKYNTLSAPTGALSLDFIDIIMIG